jgi:uncharacterized protein (DUF2147 family)
MMRACLFFASVALQMTATPVFAGDVAGTWLRDNGAYQVRFEPCGDAVCGDIVWLKPSADTKAKIGQRVFFDMKPDGDNAWAGKAKTPDGTTYSGKMSMTGNSLTTSGCVIGGLICKSIQWSRVR